jgi:hypothetical protein
MRTYLLLIACAFAVGATIATAGGPARQSSAPAKPQKVDEAGFDSQFPITDANAPAPTDPRRHAKWKAKSKKYKDIGMPIDEEGDTISFWDEWDIGLPALPVSQSGMVVVGEVVDARSYLSESKNWVYSEFTVRVEEVLKNAGGVTLSKGSSIDVDRDGGRVRFPNGQVTLQFMHGQGMPRPGRRYALFLTFDAQDQDAHILTGYELRGGRVFPLDNSPGPLTTEYKGADEKTFLNDLRAAIAKVK